MSNISPFLQYKCSRQILVTAVNALSAGVMVEGIWFASTGGGDERTGAGGVRGRHRGVPRPGGAWPGIAPGLPGVADRVGLADRRQADPVGGGTAVRGPADRAAGPARRARDRDTTE